MTYASPSRRMAGLLIATTFTIVSAAVCTGGDADSSEFQTIVSRRLEITNISLSLAITTEVDLVQPVRTKTKQFVRVLWMDDCQRVDFENQDATGGKRNSSFVQCHDQLITVPDDPQAAVLINSVGSDRASFCYGLHPRWFGLAPLNFGSSDYLGGWLVKRGHAGHHWGCV